jgi:hypothetical protein
MTGKYEVETTTVFHTPHGDLEVPGETIEIEAPSVKATYKSNLAPLWLVFPEHIFNTSKITAIRKGVKSVVITSEEREWTVHVNDVETTWSALQKAFAEGVSDTA